MARRQSTKATTPCTITTRLQAKRSQGNIAETNILHKRMDNTTGMKKRNKRQARNRKRQLKLAAMKLHALENNIQNIKTKSFVAEQRDILPDNEIAVVRQEFHNERRVSLMQSPTGKSFQITCRNNVEITKNQADDSMRKENKPLPSCSTEFPIRNGRNELSAKFDEPSTDCLHNLPLANSDRLQLMKKREYNILNKLNQINDENKTNRFNEDEDIICLDNTIKLTDNVDDDDVVCINDSYNETSASLIIIDDESRDETLPTGNTNKMETIDLTAPSPARAIIDSSAQTLRKLIRPFTHISNTNGHNTQSFTSNQVFPAIHELHHPASSSNRSDSSINSRSNPVATFVSNPTSSSTSNPNPDLFQMPIPSSIFNSMSFFQSHDPHTFNYNLQSNIYGDNFLNVGTIKTTGLRPIFIDACNVAMLHSNGKYFSVKGIKICVDYFKMRGHEVTAIAPQVRKRQGQNSDPKLLYKLEKDGLLIFTPSRVINGKHIIPYDDRFIVQLAAVYQGVVVSCDNYKDLLAENPYLRDTIENRVLNPTFLKDMIIFPSDPLGRYGPRLDEFLQFPPQ